MRLFQLALCIIAFSISLFSKPSHAAEKPNILWITAEDMSAVLGCYGDKFAHTPNIDQFARESIMYTNAFATAPVCSPSRSCLINGIMASSQGTQQMRSAFPILESMIGFPSFLRQAGYYTTNNVKTDYNSANYKTIIEKSWDESSDKAHWRNKPGKKPFFSIFNLMTSHQSRAMVWPYEKFQTDVQSRISPEVVHSPTKVILPPYYPDHPVIRETVARFYDCVTAMDKEVGTILKNLKEDNLSENTIVFFYSDHGTGLPRHKRAALDSGLHVPLLVRFPKKWQHLAPKGLSAGSKTDRLVNFEDFGPSVLSLAGLDIPDYMNGKPFMGKAEAEPRDYVFAHRDRVDEAIDLVRSARDKRFLYVRNFMPHISYNQPTAWPDQGEVRSAFYAATNRKTMTDAQWHFAGPTKPIEELYDCESDPMNIHNLAKDPKHAKTLKRMRETLFRHIAESGDLGFLPESHAWDLVNATGKSPIEMKRGIPGTYEQKPLVRAASQVGVNIYAATSNLSSEDPGVRYWGAVAMSAAPSLDKQQIIRLNELLSDRVLSVRIEAANALLRHGKSSAALETLKEALKHENLSGVHHAARTIQLLGDKASSLVNAMQECDQRAKRIRPPGTSPVVVQPKKDMAMFIGFATEAFLNKQASKIKGAKDSGSGDADWISLFDGKSLNGWEADPKFASVKDGEIHIMSKKTNYWLLSERRFKDFELMADVHMPAPNGYNSGIGFRCTLQPGKKGKPAKPDGFQCEIAGKKSGSIYAIGKGWILPKDKNSWDTFYKVAGDSFKEKSWNSFRLMVQGDHIRIWVNDTQTADVKSDLFKEGSIALQHHGKGDVHRFRNIRIREIK